LGDRLPLDRGDETQRGPAARTAQGIVAKDALEEQSERVRNFSRCVTASVKPTA
jgi:hypothetical protein